MLLSDDALKAGEYVTAEMLHPKFIKKKFKKVGRIEEFEEDRVLVRCPYDDKELTLAPYKLGLLYKPFVHHFKLPKFCSSAAFGMTIAPGSDFAKRISERVFNPPIEKKYPDQLAVEAEKKRKIFIPGDENIQPPSKIAKLENIDQEAALETSEKVLS